MNYEPPCQKPENDPDDWFLSKDGKQYPDDEIPGASDDDIAQALAQRSFELDRELTDKEARKVEQRLRDDALREQLRKRRHAKDKCHVECYARTRCLDFALRNPSLAYGTWGGYYEEEVKELREEIERRRTAKQQG